MGFVPGVLLILFFGILGTYTGYTIALFKRSHPSIHNFADVGLMIAGPWGECCIAVAQALVFVFIMAAHVLAFAIMMNVLSDHALCTVAFSAIGTFISVGLSLPRTMRKASFLSALACVFILTAVFITMIGVGILQPNPDTAVLATRVSPRTLQAYAVGMSNIVIAFTGHTAYFGFISELRQPRDFPKALALLQSLAITCYIVVAVVIYRYAGDTVASPALGSTDPTIRKVAYGVACPTIVAAGVVNAHVCVKNIYVRVWRGTQVMHERILRSLGTWVLLLAAVWLSAFLVAESIPVFHELLGLMGSLSCSWFSLGLPTLFWMWLNWGKLGKDAGWRTLTALNVFILLVSIFVCVFGAYGSAKAIAKSSTIQRPFSCADNS